MDGRSLAESAEASRGVRPGTWLKHGEYRLKRLLGWSPLSSVWSASSARPPAAVAVKVSMLGSEAATRCLFTEAEALLDLQQQQQAAQSSPGHDTPPQHEESRVVRLLDAFAHPVPCGATPATAKAPAAVHCLVLERLGDSLRDALQPPQRSKVGGLATLSGSAADVASPGTPLPIDDVRALARDLLLALHHTHSRGWVHRDVKPGNLLRARAAGPRSPTSATPALLGAADAANPGANGSGAAAAAHPGAQWKLADFGNACRVPLTTAGGPAGPPLSAALGQQRRQPAESGGWWGGGGGGGGGSGALAVMQTLAYAPPEDLLGLLPPPGGVVGPAATRLGGGGGDAAEVGSSGRRLGREAAAAWAHPANDVWSAACVVYEALSGRKLLDAARCRQLLSLHQAAGSVPPGGAAGAGGGGPPQPRRTWGRGAGGAPPLSCAPAPASGLDFSLAGGGGGGGGGRRGAVLLLHTSSTPEMATQVAAVQRLGGVWAAGQLAVGGTADAGRQQGWGGWHDDDGWARLAAVWWQRAAAGWAQQEARWAAPRPLALASLVGQGGWGAAATGGGGTEGGGGGRKESGGCLPVEALEEEDLHLWHMVHVLWPVDAQLLRRATLEPAVACLDPEGGSRLDHHPSAACVLLDARRAATAAATATRPGPAAGDAAPRGAPTPAARPQPWGAPPSWLPWAGRGGSAEAPRDREEGAARRHQGGSGSSSSSRVAAAAALLPLRERLRLECPHLGEAQAEEALAFLGPMLAYAPEARPTAAQALAHPFVAGTGRAD